MSQTIIGSGGGGFMIIYIIALFALLYFLMIRPQKKNQERHKQMLNALKINDRIQTVGGITGYVRDVSDTYVYIEIADGLVIELNRQYVAMVLHDEEDDAPVEDVQEVEAAPEVEAAEETPEKQADEANDKTTEEQK
ncbi:MAG: preprotein translocase subunit YajC [Peptococcaceae bacterium]|nr:preprotein translocase subunit YajC [Peptococcaceae bacterium]